MNLTTLKLSDDPCSAGVSASDEVETISVGEAGDREEPGEVEQPSVEELTGEQKTDDHSRLAGKHRLTAWLPWRWDYIYIITACVN